MSILGKIRTKINSTATGSDIPVVADNTKGAK